VHAEIRMVKNVAARVSLALAQVENLTPHRILSFSPENLSFIS